MLCQNDKTTANIAIAKMPATEQIFSTFVILLCFSQAE